MPTDTLSPIVVSYVYVLCNIQPNYILLTKFGASTRYGPSNPTRPVLGTVNLLDVLSNFEWGGYFDWDRLLTFIFLDLTHLLVASLVNICFMVFLSFYSLSTLYFQHE